MSGKKQLSIEVRGQQHVWNFNFEGDPRHIPDWEADGLRVSYVVNTIPGWVPARLTRAWCIAQDIFHFQWFARKDAPPHE